MGEFPALEREIALLRELVAARRVRPRLTCAECGVVDDGGRGWTLRLDIDDELVAFCPDCDDREFGGQP